MSFLPVDVTCLVQIHDDEKPDEDLTHISAQEILKHYNMVAIIESFPIIQKTGIDR